MNPHWRTGLCRWLFACACVLALAAVGCRRGKDGANLRTSTVTVAYCCGGEVLTPWIDEEASTLVFLPLVTENAQGEYEGRLARTWEYSPDYREWTYHLRKDVRWHDGVPVTARDVEFSLKLLSEQKIDVGLSGIESITVHDDSTVTIRYAQPTDALKWGGVYYPKHLLGGLDPKKIREWKFWARPVGNGPYRFVRYLPETLMEMEANPDYYRGKPRIQRVVLKFVGHAALTELLSGGVDLIPYADPAHIPKLAADPRFQVSHQIVTSLVHAIYWRTDHPLLADSNVRQALTLAINRRELLQMLGFPEGTPIVDGVFTKGQLHRGELSEPLPYDPARAQALFDAAGWRDRAGDGVRERNGKSFRFAALVTVREGVQAMALYVQEELRRVGVRMELQPMDQESVRERLKAGQFEAAFHFFRQKPTWLPQEFALTRYENARMVELIDRATATVDPDELDRIYRQLAEISRTDVPVTFLLPFLDTFFAHRRIRGLSQLFLTDPIEHMEDLWLEDRGGQ